MSLLSRLASAPSRTPPPCDDISNETESLEINKDKITEKNFWNIKGYKYAVKRCDDGYKLGESLKECLTELADVEDAYSKSLKKWEKKWLAHLQSPESSEYQSSRDNWVSLLKTGSDIADIHSDVSDKLKRTPIDNIKNWLEENYKKSFLHFKKTKEFEKQFHDAQKNWQGYMEKVKTAKDAFFLADKKLREYETNLKIKFNAADANSVAKREAERKVEASKFDREQSEKRYREELEQLKINEPTYRNNMQTVFDEVNLFEEVRLKFFKQIYSNCLEIIQQQQGKLENICSEFSNKIDNSNHENDLKWWSNNYGTGMPFILPKFESPL